ncbi:Adenylate isopentenyltransferase [Rhynchospora pubera]|uniref:adenylate dimethylallyltransferase (ADP/ATP-dependent) n=1 Tax=Rhynchospora pubera TaxID=906938 RepID=A0AAV8DX50_9POAL|nr:Adenylate isopentenyltransferase [Rhynchospora pubera]
MPTISGASKIKVVFILGATGTGKSKLAIALGKSFNGEIINSDKIQVYDAIPVITNRVSESEISAAPHHLLAFLPSDAEFHATDFIHHCVDSISSVACRNHLPIVAGGSNSYIKALLEDPDFCAGHESCFIWLDAHPSILNRFVSARVDCMMQKGLVEEARSLFDPENNDYNKGVKKAIGVPELDEYFRGEIAGSTNQGELERMLNEAANNIKANTCKLIQSQVQKIWQLKNLDRWHIHRVDVFGIKIGWKSESCGGK